MKKKLILPIVGLLLGAIVVISLTTSKSNHQAEIAILVKSEPFEITVVNSGELEAKNAIPIMGPEGLVAARIWSVRIEDMVPEGTIVAKGDYVATLDRTEIGERIRNEELDGEESLNNYEQTRIDTALDLRARRDELKKKMLNVERKEIELANSKFEPPAIIQQAELALKEATMDLELAESDYLLRKEKASTKMRRRQLDLIDDRGDLQLLEGLYGQFIIHAPQQGMVIFRKDRGAKVKKGSSVSARNPVIATLPDLSQMISRCYVNEVDIRLVEVGQIVRLGIDAFPDKKLTGKVISIANVGEATYSGDAKVFEVEVELLESDPDLKPGMTTSNEIIVDSYNNVLSIPLECLHNADDSLSYVFKKDGMQITKQTVITGKSNSNKIIISEGLNEADRIFLSIPKNADKLRLAKL